MFLFLMFCINYSFCQTDCRPMTLETLKNTFDSKFSNFYIKNDNLYLEFDLNSPHTLAAIHNVPDYDVNLYNQAKNQAYILFKRMDDIGILKEGGEGSVFKCSFVTYYTTINYITTDGQIIPFKMYISRLDVEKNIDSFNRDDFFSHLKRI